MKADCIQTTLQILGDKWTALIVRHLYDQKSARFSDLQQSLDGISPRTLSQRLDKLTTQNIICSQQYCAHPPRVTYSLTPKGQELQKILVQMANWGTTYAAANKPNKSSVV
jgi:DNA-binding HxlR family transcriptional regulator